MDLAYYPGYSLYQSAKLYNHQTKLVFGILDLKLIELEDWSCCGATSAGKINNFMAVALPARNLGKAESTGRLQSACYSGPMNTRFPYDVPISDNVENPQGMETVLKAIGVTALDWNYKTLCCGASSIICNPDNALDLIAKIMRDALSMGSDCLVVNCPMCQMNMESGPQQIGSVVIIGAGIGGMQAALDLADSGFMVHLVSKDSAVGGTMAMLDKTFAKEKQAEEGIKICLETIERLKEVKGVSGFHIMAIEWEEKVPEIVERAGLFPRPKIIA